MRCPLAAYYHRLSHHAPSPPPSPLMPTLLNKFHDSPPPSTHVYLLAHFVQQISRSLNFFNTRGCRTVTLVQAHQNAPDHIAGQTELTNASFLSVSYDSQCKLMIKLRHIKESLHTWALTVTFMTTVCFRQGRDVKILEGLFRHCCSWENTQ